MTQHCKVTFGNISKNNVLERVFDSKNQALIWINHEMVRQSSFDSVHELYFRLESYNNDSPQDFNMLPF